MNFVVRVLRVVVGIPKTPSCFSYTIQAGGCGIQYLEGLYIGFCL